MIEALRFRDYDLKEEKKETLWHNINRKIGEKENSEPHTAKVYPINSNSTQKGPGKNNITFFVKLAAVFIFMAVLSILIIRNADRERTTNDQKVTIIEKTNPKGQKSKVFLPDGSIVYLNAASTISYPSEFHLERDITLVGEAYFEVKKDSLRPFKVQSGDVITTALGTAFNVKSFTEEGEVIVSLVRGKVKIETVEKNAQETLLLLPGQAADYIRNSKELQKKSFDKADAIAWKDGVIIFDNTPLSDVFNRLENWYGVNFRVLNEPENNNVVISGKFDNEYLTNVLLSLSYTARFNYELNDKEVVVHFKNNVPM